MLVGLWAGLHKNKSTAFKLWWRTGPQPEEFKEYFLTLNWSQGKTHFLKHLCSFSQEKCMKIKGRTAVADIYEWVQNRTVGRAWRRYALYWAPTCSTNTGPSDPPPGSAGSDSSDHDTARKVLCPLIPDAAKDTRQYNKNMTERATTLLKCRNACSEAG